MTPDRHAAVVMAFKFAAEEWAQGDVPMAERLCAVVWQQVETIGFEFIDDEEASR